MVFHRVTYGVTIQNVLEIFYRFATGFLYLGGFVLRKKPAGFHTKFAPVFGDSKIKQRADALLDFVVGFLSVH